MNPMLATVLTFAIPLVLVVALFARTGPERPLSLWHLLIVPAVAVVTIAGSLLLQEHPPFGTLAWAALGGGALIGLVTGTLRAGTVHLRIDPATGQLLAQTSSYAFILFAALFGMRFVGAWTRGHEAVSLTLFDAALCFALAMILAQRLGMFRRAQALLRTALPTA